MTPLRPMHYGCLIGNKGAVLLLVKMKSRGVCVTKLGMNAMCMV